MKLVQSNEKIYWTKHAESKMRHYCLSKQRLKRVLRSPDRKELGVAPNTIAVMQIAGTKKHPTEIWLMYQKANFREKKKIIKIISGWRYPGISPKGKLPSIPEDTLWELKRMEEMEEVGATEKHHPDYLKPFFIKFLNCKINLSKRVFIPRIETEYWLRKAIREIKKEKGAVKILDIFSGSGCIGIAVLKNIKDSFVDFADVDRKAIFQIKVNLRLNKISLKKYKIYRSSFFKKLKGEKYDFIFANPPYVAEERLNEVEKSVLEYEPKTALLSGKKGLSHIKNF